MGKPMEITDANFENEVLKSELPVLVDFWAEWCGPCHMIAPAIEEIASEYEGKIKVGKLNVDNNMNTASKFGIRGIPTVLIFKNGQVAAQFVGVQPKNVITKKLETLAVGAQQ